MLNTLNKFFYDYKHVEKCEKIRIKGQFLILLIFLIFEC